MLIPNCIYRFTISSNVRIFTVDLRLCIIYSHNIEFHKVLGMYLLPVPFLTNNQVL